MSLAAAAGAVAAPAGAAVFRAEGILTGTDFTGLDPAPFDPFILTFGFDIDGSANIPQTPLAPAFASANIPGGVPISFAYNAGSDSLLLGTNVSPIGCSLLPSGAAIQICALVSNISTAPTIGYLNYRANGQNWFATALSFTPLDPPGPVPEPASWALMLLGFGALGGALRAARRPGLAHRALSAPHKHFDPVRFAVESLRGERGCG